MGDSTHQLTLGASSQTAWLACTILFTVIFLRFPTTTVEVWKPDSTTIPAEEVIISEPKKYINLIRQPFGNSI